MQPHLASHAHYQVWHKAASQPEKEIDKEGGDGLLKYPLHANHEKRYPSIPSILEIIKPSSLQGYVLMQHER